MPQSLESFYDQNEVRRSSAEVEFGSEWTNEDGVSFELSYVMDTGELYLMTTPTATVLTDFFGDAITYNEDSDEMLVKIIATVPSLDEVESRLTGWQDAMQADNSLSWLAQVFPQN